MKNKNILLSIVIVLLVIVIGIGGGYLIYSNNSNNKNDDVSNNVENNIKSIVSIESIKELARNNKYIYDNFENKINFEISYEENSQINNQSLYLLLEDGKVYLYSNSYKEYDYELKDYVEKNGKEYKSLISNINEQVVMIKETISGGCVIDALEYAILTDKGDVYTISFAENVGDSDEILTALSKNKDVNLSLNKLNKNNLKVLAFTKYYYDDRGNTCTGHPSPIYASDNTLRDYETFEQVKPIIFHTENYNDTGFVVYEDYTISIDNNDLVKDKNNNNLLIKAFYKDDTSNNILILDKDNYMYYQDENDNNIIKLYKNVKVKEVLKETLSDGDTLSNWDDVIKYTFNFENNDTLEIKVVYGEDKIFE